MDPLLFERTDSIVAAVLGLAEDATPTAVKDTDLDGLRSVYVDHSLGCTAEFEAADTGTVLHIMGERLALERTGQGAYRPTKTSAYFPFRIANRERHGRPIVEMKLATADWVEMIPWVETDAAGFDAADYVGEYRSQAMGETHYVLALDGGLEITLASPTRTLLWWIASTTTWSAIVASAFPGGVTGHDQAPRHRLSAQPPRSASGSAARPYRERSLPLA